MGRRLLLVTILLATPLAAEQPTEPLSAQEVEDIHRQLDAQIADLTSQIAAKPESVALRSSRGTALFFRGRFDESAADFDKMVELDPAQEAGHWRRGIALYYVGKYAESARQFGLYHSFDNVDRENGIWRYLAQAKANGADRAKKELLKYEKDDRAPFPDVYALFAGSIDAAEVFRRIEAKKLGESERDKQLFYAHLYAGLFADAHDRKGEARNHLALAVGNRWGRSAGGGPGYMWHVARVHYDTLTRKPAGPRPDGQKSPQLFLEFLLSISRYAL